MSRYGLVAFASSLDQIGPFANSVADAALVFDVIAGPDLLDSTSIVDVPEPVLPVLDDGVAGLRVGIIEELMDVDGVQPEVHAAVERAGAALKDAGAAVERVSVPSATYGLAAYYLIAPAEASSNLARYDGVRYGLRADGAGDVVEMNMATRGQGFGDEVKRRIILGTYALSAGYGHKYYLKASQMRTLIKKDFDDAFQHCDVILSPTSPTPAFKAGEKTGDPLQMYLCDVFTVTCNIAGIPGISLPCGFSTGDKPLPIGMQLLGPTFSEEKLFRAARMYEAATDWHKRRPKIG